MKAIALSLAVALLALTAHAANGPPARLIVKLKPKPANSAEPPTAHARVRALGAQLDTRLRVVRMLSGGAQLVASLGLDTAQAERLARALAARDDVEYAEVDTRRYVSLIPNDPRFVDQGYLSEAVTGINAPPAWDVTTGSSANVLAVIDTGILPEHADLLNRVLPGYDFISADPVDSEDPQVKFFTANDGDGRDPDPTDPGDHVEAEQCGPEAPAMQSRWHGTRVTSLIGAVGNDAQGMAGVDWQTQILPVRVIGRCGGFLSDITDALRWAVGLPVPGLASNPNPAKIVNLSLGAEGPCQNAEQAAINDVLVAGAVVIVAAGNETTNALRSAPANCDGVLTVGATRFDGGLAGFSNYGIKVSLSAPGTNLVSAANSGTTQAAPSPDGDVHNDASGTSFAAPLVSGIAALMLSVNNALTPAEIKGTLRATTHAFPASSGQSCGDPLCGSGIVDAASAVEAVANGTVVSASHGSDGVSNAFGNAVPIEPNTTTPASLDAAFELDVYRIELGSGGTLTAITTGDSDTYGYLFDGQGKLLVQADDIEHPGNLNFEISQRLAAGGYFVAVEGFNRNVRGAYTLQTAFTGGSGGGGGGGGGAIGVLTMATWVALRVRRRSRQGLRTGLRALIESLRLRYEIWQPPAKPSPISHLDGIALLVIDEECLRRTVSGRLISDSYVAAASSGVAARGTVAHGRAQLPRLDPKIGK